MKKKMNVKSLIFLLLCLFYLVFKVPMVHAGLRFGDFTLTGFLYNETYFQIHGPETLQSSRNVLNLDLEYTSPRISAFVEFRPVYEAMFDLDSGGFNGTHGEAADHLRHNIGRNDDWEPLAREVWVNLNYDRLEAKLGRQLVSWGRSDGIYLLDLIHPFNFRNFTTFREEDTKIPLWMVNLNYWFTSENSLQLIYIPRYTPAFPQAHNDTTGVPWFADYGRQWHKGMAFVPNITKFVFDFFGFMDNLFKSFGAPGFPVMIDEPNTSLSNSEIGVQWRGYFKGLTYTLNYFYTWTDFLSFRPNTGSWLNATGVKATADRISIFGGSFDYGFTRALGLENWVLRGEVAYFKNNPFYNYDVYIKEKDYIGWMFGFDKYFFVDYWVSMQFAGSYILDADHSKQTYTDIGTNNTGMGMRDEVETTYTLFMMKDYLPADILHTELFLLFDDDGDWWFRPKVKYELINNKLWASLGCNFFWGNHDDYIGEYSDRDNIFIELKYDLF